MKRLVLATLVVIGVTNAIVSGNDDNDLKRCPNGNKDCEPDHHCNEFKICIPGAPSNDLVRCPNGHKDCPSDQHCNEFKICIPGAPSNDLVRCPNGHKDCPSNQHCNEFKICINGAPSNDNGRVMCYSDSDCASYQYCTSSAGGVCASRRDNAEDDNACGPPMCPWNITVSTNDLKRCKKNNECDITKEHCNEFGICINGAPAAGEENACGPPMCNYTELTRCKKHTDCDVTQQHCNEFGICIAGKPSTENGELMCFSDEDCGPTRYCTDTRGGVCKNRRQDDATDSSSNDLTRCPNGHKDCPSNMHCNEFKICINGAPSNELTRCPNGHKDCPSNMHCNEFKICINGAPSNEENACSPPMCPWNLTASSCSSNSDCSS